MSKKLLVFHSALLAVGTLLMATSVQAKTVTLRWTHADVSGQQVVGFRLFQRVPGANWGPPIAELMLSDLTPSVQGIYQHDIEVDSTRTFSFAATAFTDQAESYLSNEQELVSDVPPTEPGDQYLASYTFDGAPGEPSGWLDTGANNSLSESAGLFRTDTIDGQGAFVTDSSATNIHSHVLPGDPGQWVDYEYRGRMRKDEANGAIGLTVYSQYPASDAYYRIRSLDSTSDFHVENHSATGLACNTMRTGVTPAPGVWYSFKIRVETFGSETLLKASIWPEASSEPAAWQLDCYDDTAGRLTQGTVGVWSMDGGAKYWDDLEVLMLEPPSFMPPPPPAPAFLP